MGHHRNSKTIRIPLELEAEFQHRINEYKIEKLRKAQEVLKQRQQEQESAA